MTIDVEKHYGLVGWVINKYYKDFLHNYPTISYDDLFQEGVIGLLIAAENYDPSYKTEFSTYAVYQIQQQMDEFVRTNSRPITYSYRTANQEKKVKDLESAKAIQEELGISERKALEILHYRENVHPTELAVDFYRSTNPTDSMINMIYLSIIFSELNSEDQTIFQMRMGGKTLREIGFFMELSHTTIANRLKKIHKKYRDY